MTRRALLPYRDTMRVVLLLTAAKWIAVLVFVVAFFLGPDAVVSWVMAR